MLFLFFAYCLFQACLVSFIPGASWQLQHITVCSCTCRACPVLFLAAETCRSFCCCTVLHSSCGTAAPDPGMCSAVQPLRKSKLDRSKLCEYPVLQATQPQLLPVAVLVCWCAHYEAFCCCLQSRQLQAHTAVAAVAFRASFVSWQQFPFAPASLCCLLLHCRGGCQ